MEIMSLDFCCKLLIDVFYLRISCHMYYLGNKIISKFSSEFRVTFAKEINIPFIKFFYPFSYRGSSRTHFTLYRCSLFWTYIVIASSESNLGGVEKGGLRDIIWLILAWWTRSNTRKLLLVNAWITGCVNGRSGKKSEYLILLMFDTSGLNSDRLDDSKRHSFVWIPRADLWPITWIIDQFRFIISSS